MDTGYPGSIHPQLDPALGFKACPNGCGRTIAVRSRFDPEDPEQAEDQRVFRILVGLMIEAGYEVEARRLLGDDHVDRYLER